MSLIISFISNQLFCRTRQRSFWTRWSYSWLLCWL